MTKLLAAADGRHAARNPPLQRRVTKLLAAADGRHVLCVAPIAAAHNREGCRPNQGGMCSQQIGPVLLRYLALLACALGSSGCGARPLLPTVSLHAVLTLRQRAVDARQIGSNDFGLLAQIAFRPRGSTRTVHDVAFNSQVPIALPRQPDCQYALACEWAQLAEESTLNALGVTP